MFAHLKSMLPSMSLVPPRAISCVFDWNKPESFDILNGVCGTPISLFSGSCKDHAGIRW